MTFFRLADLGALATTTAIWERQQPSLRSERFRASSSRKSGREQFSNFCAITSSETLATQANRNLTLLGSQSAFCFQSLQLVTIRENSIYENSPKFIKTERVGIIANNVKSLRFYYMITDTFAQYHFGHGSVLHAPISCV